MFKALKISTTALLLTAVATTSAMARGEPWLSKRPKMTDEQLASVQAADAVRKTLPKDRFGFDPEKVDWKGWRGNRKRVPLANMSAAELTKLVQGKYRVSNRGRSVGISYFGMDGLSFDCDIKGPRVTNLVARYKVQDSAFGLAGLSYSTNLEEEVGGRGWSIVGDNKTGLVYQFTYDRKGASTYPGWIQTEIPAVAAELCPDLPNNGKVNRAQTKGDFDDLLANSNRVTGFKVAFPNNPQNPMTAEMFYHFYSPSN